MKTGEDIRTYLFFLSLRFSVPDYQVWRKPSTYSEARAELTMTKSVYFPLFHALASWIRYLVAPLVGWLVAAVSCQCYSVAIAQSSVRISSFSALQSITHFAHGRVPSQFLFWVLDVYS